mmetsp:Transcript_42736/g.91695  ORF Transcript_42736/g.91695 Transcript_42736/m.91695 type:complete len:465 (+) Transcript_42736:125-1519(+)
MDMQLPITCIGGQVAPRSKRLLAILVRAPGVVLKWILRQLKVLLVDNHLVYILLSLNIGMAFHILIDPRKWAAVANMTGSTWLALTAVEFDGRMLSALGPKFQGNRDVVLTASRTHRALSLQHVSRALRNDREIVLEAVLSCGFELANASEELRDDKEIVMAAVQQHGLALEYAHERWRSDREVVLAAVQRNGKALQFATKWHRNDRDVVLAAVKRSGLALIWASKELQADRDIVLAAVKHRGSALKHAADELKKDPEVVLAAVKQNSLALWSANRQLLMDLEFAVAVVRQDEETFNFWPGQEAEKADFAAAVKSKLALPGEEGAPVLSVELHFIGPETVECRASFPSGRTIEVTLPLKDTVGKLAAELVDRRPPDMEAFERVFVVMQIGQQAGEEQQQEAQAGQEQPQQPEQQGQQEEQEGQEEQGCAAVTMSPTHYNVPLWAFGPGKFLSGKVPCGRRVKTF